MMDDMDDPVRLRFRGHILNCGKTATNTCIIMLRLSRAKPGNLASKHNIDNILNHESMTAVAGT